MKRLLASLGIAGALALIAGCGDPHAAGSTGQTRLIDALVGVSGIDVAVSHGNVSGTNLGIGTVTRYIQGPYGNTTVTARQTATTTVVAGPTQVAEAQEQAQTIVVAGVIGQVGLQAPTIFLIPDTPPAQVAGAPSFRLVNLSPDSPPLSLFASATSSSPGQTGATAISYKNASSYVPVTTGNGGAVFMSLYDANNTLAVPIITNINTNAFDLTTTGAYTAFIVGMVNPALGQAPLQLVFVDDSTGGVIGTLVVGGTVGTT